jgi:hypothetical protein
MILFIMYWHVLDYLLNLFRNWSVTCFRSIMEQNSLAMRYGDVYHQRISKSPSLSDLYMIYLYLTNRKVIKQI